MDSSGDVQKSLSWKKRTIVNKEQNEQIFFYFELNENDLLKLTKLDSKGKLLYSHNLCQLEFRMKINVRDLFV